MQPSGDFSELTVYEKAVGVIVFLLIGAVGIVSAMIRYLWIKNDEKHEAANKERMQIRGDIVELKLHKIGDDTLGEMKEEWQKELERLRMDRRETHAENIVRLEKIDQKLNELVSLAIIVSSIKEELGDHQSGIRGQLHQHRTNLMRLAGMIPGAMEIIE